MRRVIVTAIAAGLMLVALVSPAAAAKPIWENVPLGDLDLTVEAGLGCSFPVLIEDLKGSIVHSSVERHGVVYDTYQWRTVSRLTNVADTSKWIQFKFWSVLNVQVQPDGRTRILGLNDSIVWYVEGDPSELGPGMWLINHGISVEEYNSAGDLVNATVHGGRITDVCAALS